MRLIVCLLWASLTRAATLESTARPASLNIVLTPNGEASAGLLSLSCKGYSYVGGYKPDVDVNLEPPLPRPRVTTEFLGADPGCLVRTGPVLPEPETSTPAPASPNARKAPPATPVSISRMSGPEWTSRWKWKAAAPA